MTTIGAIEIEGMEFFAYHGCYREEQIIGTNFLVDLRIETDMSKSLASDNIEDAVNYQIAYEIVSQEMQKPSKLIEHVANRILIQLHEKLNGILKATVKVAKLNPQIGGKISKVQVTLSL